MKLGYFGYQDPLLHTPANDFLKSKYFLSGVEAFPANQIAEALLETLKASQQSAKQAEINKNTTEKREPKKKERLCDQHGKPLELYCADFSCKRSPFLCALCMTEKKHHGHNVKSLESELRWNRRFLENDKREFDQISSTWRKHLYKLQTDVVTERGRETTKTLGMIEDRKREIISEVEKMTGCLREKVLHIHQEGLNEIYAECEVIKKYASKSETYANECQKLLDSDDPVLIMENHHKYSEILNSLIEKEDYVVTKNANCPIFAKSDFKFTFSTDSVKILGSVTTGSKALPKAVLPKYVAYGKPSYIHEKTFYTEEWNRFSNRKMCVVDDCIILCGHTNDGCSIFGTYQYPGKFKGKATWTLKIQGVVAEISEVVLQSESFLAVSLPEKHTISFYKVNSIATEGVIKLMLIGDYSNEDIMPGKVTSYRNKNIVVVNNKRKPVELVVLADFDLDSKIAQRVRSLSTGLPHHRAHITGICCKTINQRPAVLFSCADEKLAIGLDLRELGNGGRIWEHKERLSSICVDERNLIHCHGLKTDRGHQFIYIFHPDGRYNTLECIPTRQDNGSTVEMCILRGSKLVVHCEEDTSHASIQVFAISYRH